MRINRVYLENYRIHEKLEIEFSKGINLLLGENGKGKSSILEAIGYALFDSGLRTKSRAEAIKFGKKNAKIEVDFVGIDGEEYRVVKKFNSRKGVTELFKGEEVLIDKVEKVRELCGIKGDLKDIYDNVIVAKQNEFILAFKESATEREKIFNRVFNTDIYTKIYEGYTREILGKYKLDLEILKNNVSHMAGNLIDSKELEEKLELLNDKLKGQKEYEELLDKRSFKIKNELKELLEIRKRIEQLCVLKSNSEKTILDREIERDENIKFIEESKRAEQIVQENRADYENYQKVLEKLVEIKESKKVVEKEKDEYLQYEKKKILSEQELSKIIGEIEVIKNKEENITKLLSEREKRIEILTQEREAKQNEASEYQKELERLAPILKYALETDEKILQAKHDLKKQEGKISEKKVEIERVSEEITRLEEKKLGAILEKLEADERILRELEAKNKILYTQKKENQEAFSMLKSATCPYLKESCENLKGRDISEFFNEKLERIEKEIAENLQKLKELERVLKEKDKVQNEIYRYEDLKKTLVEKKSELEKEEIRLENWNMRYQLGEKEYSEYKIKEGFSDTEELKKLKVSYETKLNTLELESYIKDIEELKVERENLLENLKENSNLVEILKTKKMDIENFIESMRLYLESKKDVDERFRNINFELEKRESELNLLEKGKELYIENHKKALEKERYEKNLEKLEKILRDERESIESLTIEIGKEMSKQSMYDEEDLTQKELELNEELKNIRGDIGETRTEINYHQGKLLEAKKIEENLQEEKRKLDRLSAKIQLTESFREKIKNMGKEVSKSMLKEIEITATENFRKITGRGEKLIWSNEDKDKYSVYLLGDRGELKFEQLSGGEQVAVAIAIRGAMSTVFTSSNFSIFDEPTNNLDTERRKCLADSIGEILKNLDQSIIVTHDDTFREMAERVIEL